MYGTANTMAVFAEAIGLCPFGSGYNAVLCVRKV